MPNTKYLQKLEDFELIKFRQHKLRYYFLRSFFNPLIKIGGNQSTIFSFISGKNFSPFVSTNNVECLLKDTSLTGLPVEK